MSSYVVADGVGMATQTPFGCLVVRSALAHSSSFYAAAAVRLSVPAVVPPMASARHVRSAQGRSILAWSAFGSRFTSPAVVLPMYAAWVIRSARGFVVPHLDARSYIQLRVEYRVYPLSAYAAIFTTRGAVGAPLFVGGAEPVPSTGQLWPVAG